MRGMYVMSGMYGMYGIYDMYGMYVCEVKVEKMRKGKISVGRKNTRLPLRILEAFNVNVKPDCVTDRQTDRQTNKHTYKQTDTPNLWIIYSNYI
uniref:Ovule protein n=1 Tax=Haemonchus contortus TaxID=6289 RepID=A0A7I4Z3L9_HAECO